MTTARTPRKAFKIQTLNTGTGNPGWTLRVLAANKADARAKFNRENPGQTIYSIAAWSGRENH